MSSVPAQEVLKPLLNKPAYHRGLNTEFLLIRLYIDGTGREGAILCECGLLRHWLMGSGIGERMWQVIFGVIKSL